MADLMWHLAEVHDFWRTIVGEQRQSWEGYVQPERPADERLPTVFREGLDRTATCSARPIRRRRTGPGPSDHTAGFVIRRMAQETAVHRWDADDAAGRPRPVEADLASDGIDEFLHHFARLAATTLRTVGGSVHLHCTDVAGEWTVRPEGDGRFDVTPRARQGRLRDPRCGQRHPARAVAPASPSRSSTWWATRDVAARFVAYSPLD